MTSLHWFRQDLRLTDNPALYQAASKGPVLAMYIASETEEPMRGAASRVWLHHSLESLNRSLGHQLVFERGDAVSVLLRYCQQYGINEVTFNRCYEPWRVREDKVIQEALEKKGIKVVTENGSLLWEPWDIQKETPYKVFTPFYRKGCLQAKSPRLPYGKPDNLKLIKAEGLKLEQLGLLPARDWHLGLSSYWQIGEEGAYQRLQAFIPLIHEYKEGRNFPAKPYVSQLSAPLHFGEISPHQVWHAVSLVDADENTDHFCSELGWREFSYHQLYANPLLPEKNLQVKFDQFPWQKHGDYLKAWQKGLTGIPIVDAGMRQLWQTGYIHNRVRMIVASFLVKNLLIDWRLGAQWFWDCLVDADLANNSASWQWVAGCGSDAAPYFRIFNPITQAEKFDPEGIYIKTYVPELEGLSPPYLFNPSKLPLVSRKALSYPDPIVDLQQSRDKALAAFMSLK